MQTRKNVKAMILEVVPTQETVLLERPMLALFPSSSHLRLAI